MSRLHRAGGGLVAVGAVAASVATVHSALNVRRMRVPRRPPTDLDLRVSVLVPARDEAARIGQCLAAIRAQVGVPDLEVLVLDDRSSDGTGQVVAHHVEADRRVRLVHGRDEPPAGFLGKSWACHRLAEQATGDVLVFVDADVRLAPHAVAATVALLDDAGLDAVSPYPRQESVTIGERLVQPLLQWSWLTFLPLGVAERSPRPSLTAANGQLLAIRADTYRRCGGHAAIATEVLEDVALFRAVKQAGGRAAIADGTELAVCRMYDGWDSLEAGYTKSLWAAFGSPAGATGVNAVLATMYVLPAAAALRGSRWGLAGYLAGVAGRVVVGRRVESRVWPDAIAHPASVVALGWLTGRSWWLRRGDRLSWKGRAVP